jgi:uncharacterized spore protein YtfJ
MPDTQKKIQSTETSFIERLAHEVGISANAGYIYGEPVESDGVTVITIAKAAYVFGGGGGKQKNEEGSGGGGAVALTPVGYIEIKNGKTRFRPTRDWLLLIPMIAASAPVILFAIWGMTRLLGLKKSSWKTEK